MGRHHADHRKVAPAQFNRFADHTRIAGEKFLPRRIAQDDHRIRGRVPIFVHGSRFVFGKGAAKNRPGIPEREKVGRNHFSRDIIAEVFGLSLQTDAVQPPEIRKEVLVRPQGFQDGWRHSIK